MSRKYKKKFSIKKVIECIKDTAGLKTEICNRIGCSRPTLDSYIEEFEEVRNAYQEELDSVSDMAKGALFEAIEQRQPWAVMFFLDRKDPEYRRQTKTEVSGDVKTTGGVLVVPAEIEQADWERAVMRQQENMAKRNG